MKTVKDYYNNRFKDQELDRKNMTWNTLCRYSFQNHVSKKDTVMDIGAGYCEFINNIRCYKKIAVDINPETKKFAKKDVTVLNHKLDILEEKFTQKIDVIFFSNFFEHLNTKEEIIRYIEASYNMLKHGGRVIILQPNIDLAKEKYWNFIDHKQPLTVPALVEALEINNFKIGKATRKFLPFTTKNSYPIYPWMIYLYLKLPEILRIGAGQSLIVAKKI